MTEKCRCLRLKMKELHTTLMIQKNALNRVVVQYFHILIFSISDKKYKIRVVQNIDLPMMTSPDRYTPLPGFVTSAVALNQQGQPASINPKRAHKVVHVILQDNDVYVQWTNSPNHQISGI